MTHPRAEEPATDVLAAEEFGVPAPDPAIRVQAKPATDVLAAEEFGVPAVDPAFRLHAGPPMDVLAAEEFGVPAADPALHPEHLVLPADLVGAEPRDVLVAEEFAMPAPDEARVPPRSRGRRRIAIGRAILIGLPVTLGTMLLRRRRHRPKLSRRARLTRRGRRG
jgi:hypothetical protein